MKFQLPQFIETEVKLIGPLTLRQFLWLAGGAVLVFVLFISAPIFWAVVGLIFIAPVAIALAFVKVGGLPLVSFLAYALSYALNPRQYQYQSEEQKDVLPALPKQP